ncbi:albusnodin/ikarugamycin family macrolactam cyclase [Sphaerisporangium aureirubrum]|uniref:asparagine synthase (glutamine-hydrolyzing) n=1 Tax=Sphaerisporangium aureirubrum TaxID=1544736 RepID=A0ABW1NPU1_9ACTN
MPTSTCSITGEGPAGFHLSISRDARGRLATDLSPRGREAAAHTRTAEHGHDRLLMLGHGLAPPERVAAEFAAAMDRDTPDRLTTLSGGHMFVVVRPEEVLVYTDLAGQFAVYYSEKDGHTVVGSDLRELAAAHGRSPDPLTVAIHITCPNVLPLTSGRTHFRGVRTVEGGSVLRADGVRVSVRTYHDRLPDLAPSDEHVARLREALTVSVRARCTAGVVTADLSGGLDSTSLAFAAAAHTPTPLSTVVYHNPLVPAADLADAVRAAGLDDRIDLSVVRGDAETLPYQGLSHMPARPAGEPAAGVIAHRRTLLRLRWAAARGSAAHLTGEGGDALLHPPPSYLANLARHGRVLRLARDSMALGRSRNVSPAALAARAMVLAFGTHPRALAALGHRMRDPLRGSADAPAHAVAWWHVPGEPLRWLSGRTRAALSEIAGDPATARVLPEGIGPAEHTMLAELRAAARTQRYTRELGATVGVEVHAPFLDNAVVLACTRVPVARRADARAYKPLLARVMRGLVPPEVISRVTKGSYHAEEYAGARLARGEIRSLLAGSRLAALGVIDLPAFEETLIRLHMGLPAPLGAIGRLISAETWLRALDSPPRTDTC